MQEVTTGAADVGQLGRIVPQARVERLLEGAARLRDELGGATIVNVSSTAAGGGVAEMLHVLVPYARGAGVDTRWLVIEGDARFFEITKRLHNHLYGTRGDGGPLGDAEHEHYESVLDQNAAQLAGSVRPGDVVLLHDPQTAGLAGILRQRGAQVVWRCHVGTDGTNDCTDIGWEFLRRYLESPPLDAYVFSRRQFAPPWVVPARLHDIPPSIDPFAPKNQELTPEEVQAILASVGLLAGDARTADYVRSDGVRGRVEHGADLVRTGSPPGPDVPLVVQISRWDRLKDMPGVLHAFADFVVADHATHLVLAGPVVTAVADDPEGADVLRETWEAWRQLPHFARSRIALACLPMVDAEENAIIVNALQRHATIVVQKSLAEGFGLTVSEAMYKRTPVVGAAVGGIVDQIVDGESGVLLPDPSDLGALSRSLSELLAHPAELDAMGKRAHERVVDRFLPDTHLARWSELVDTVLAGRP